MPDEVTATRDSASGFGATAETNDNTQQINDLLDQARDLMVEDGLDYATAEALTNFARRPTPTIVGNLADLQRMGAIVVSGEIPVNAMPPGQDQERRETSNIEDAFAEPPAANLAPAGLQTPMGQIDEEGKPTGENVESTAPAGDTGAAEEDTAEEDAGGDLDGMTKAELLDEAESRGVEVSSSWTKAEIVAALEEDQG